MAQAIHGHEVMKMMIAENKTFSKQMLEEAIWQKFGTDTRFYTCSAQNMTAGELIDFLESRGKFIVSDEGFSTSAECICNH